MNRHALLTSPGASISLSSEALARQVGDEAVILDLAKGTYFGLDAVGTRIWNLLGEGVPVAEICDRVVSEYEVERQQAQADLIALVEALEEAGLVRIQLD